MTISGLQKHTKTLSIAVFWKRKKTSTLKRLFSYAIRRSKCSLWKTLWILFSRQWQNLRRCFIRSFEKSGKLAEASLIYERIHLYSIKYEETIFRKDYFMQLIRLLVSSNEYVRAVQSLENEIEFLKNCDKVKNDSINTYLLDLLLIHLIMHNTTKIDEIVLKYGSLH